MAGELRMEPLFSFEGLSCVRGERTLFAGLGLALEAGQCLHVAGDNGAGKTSLLRILAGLLAPAEGIVRWRGRDIREAREEYGADLAFVGHLNGVKDDLTAIENLSLGAAARGEDGSRGAAAAALAGLGLAGREDTPARRLSQGQKRRVALARLAASRAGVWILDEPFNALDRSSVATLGALIAGQLARGGLVLLTAHQDVGLPAGARRLELGGVGGVGT
jgi:heme exporter protein A